MRCPLPRSLCRLLPRLGSHQVLSLHSVPASQSWKNARRAGRLSGLSSRWVAVASITTTPIPLPSSTHRVMRGRRAQLLRPAFSSPPPPPLPLLSQVTDTGIGIPPENQPLLFRPFTQLPGPQGEKAQGVGIGLSLCKQVIEAMGGTISVSSALGHGSTFELRVPFAVEASPAAPAAAEEAQAAAEAALEEVATTLPRSMVVCVAIATPQLRVRCFTSFGPLLCPPPRRPDPPRLNLHSPTSPRHYPARAQAAVRRSVEGWGASVFETDVPCEPASACHRGSVSDVSDQPLRPGNRASLGSVGSVAPAAEIPAADAADLDEVLRCITAAADVAPGGHVLLIVEAPQLRWLVRRGFAFEDNSVQPVVVRAADPRMHVATSPPCLAFLLAAAPGDDFSPFHTRPASSFFLPSRSLGFTTRGRSSAPTLPQASSARACRS